MKFRILSAGVAAAALALGTGEANAAISWSSTGFDAAPAGGEAMVIDFDAIAQPGFVLTGGTEAGATIPGVATAPAGAATNFYYVADGGAATLLVSGILDTLSIYIGSLDVGNSIEFKRGGVSLGAFNGLQLQIPANGDIASPSTNRRFYFDFGAQGVDEVVFRSTGATFEFNNIAAAWRGTLPAVPEPGVWALLIAGFGMVGTALRRRRLMVDA